MRVFGRYPGQDGRFRDTRARRSRRGMQAVALVGVGMVAACSKPSFDARSKDGVFLFSGQVTRCVVGCDIAVTRADGTTCSGFTGGVSEQRAFRAVITCEPGTRKVLYAGNWSPNATLDATYGSDEIELVTGGS